MLLLDASTIAKNVGRRLLFAGSRRAARSHSDLGGCADGTTSSLWGDLTLTTLKVWEPFVYIISIILLLYLEQRIFGLKL